jgi:Tol biopolymer transport system component
MGTDTSVWAIPFDADSAKTTGKPFLVASGDGDPSVSDSGTLVLTRSIVGYLAGKLVKLDLASNEMEPIASPGGIFYDPAMSPDGKSIALSGFDLDSMDIWILHIEAGSRMRLTFDDATNELLPRWSPDGSEIAFAKTTATSFERMGKDDTIHFFSADGSGETRASIEGAYPSFDAEWKYVTFVRTSESTQRDIYFMPMDGSAEPQALLDQSYVEEHPALSPDGHWLAYTSSESGVQTVYLTRFPSGEGKWQVSGTGGVFPRWSPDGTRIYFTGADVGISEVRMTTKPRVMLTKPRLVVDGLKRGIDPFIGFDFTAGGKSLIVVKQHGGDRPTTIGIIENWYEEFKDRR